MFERGKQSTSDKKLNTRRAAARIEFASARSCRAECASAPFLEENGAPFTLRAKRPNPVASVLGACATHLVVYSTTQE